MSSRFTDRARRVMQLANQEALRFHHEYIGTEHILLGLVREGQVTRNSPGVASRVLNDLGIDLNRIRLAVERIIQSGPDLVTMGKLPRTPRVKRLIEHAEDEADNLNFFAVGTGLLLVGLLREEESVAAQVLINLGLDLRKVRDSVLTSLLGSGVTHAFSTKVHELPAAEFPAEIRDSVSELDRQIESLTQVKEVAVAAQEFERAADALDNADRRKRRRRAIVLEWFNGRRLDSGWLAWNGGTVEQIALQIGGEGRWGELPILADALEEAGCTDRDILDHCRQPGEHYLRGCWVIALLLGKK